MIEPPGQRGLVERLAALDRRISETQRSIPGSPGSIYGRWWLPTAASNVSIPANTPTVAAGIGTPVEPAVGCSFTGGAFRSPTPGWWLLSLSVQWLADGGRHWVWLAPAGATFPRFGGTQGTSDFQTVTVPVRLAAGEHVRPMVETTNASGLYAAEGSCQFRALWLGGLA